MRGELLLTHPRIPVLPGYMAGVTRNLRSAKLPILSFSSYKFSNVDGCLCIHFICALTEKKPEICKEEMQIALRTCQGDKQGRARK